MSRLKLFVAALACASLIAAGTAADANAVANPNASCIGQGMSFAPMLREQHGDVLSGVAHTLQPLGQAVSATAQTNTNCPGG